MLQVLNSKERNQAFLKFLFFFLITVILVITAIFFDFKMPTRENTMLQKEISIQRQQELNQNTFLQNLDEALILMDSLDKQGANVTQIDLQLSAKLNDLHEMETSFNTQNRKTNKILVQRLSDLQQKKRELKKLKQDSENLTVIQNDLQDCRSRLQSAERDLDAYRNSGN